jgi:uncharacterized protein
VYQDFQRSVAVAARPAAVWSALLDFDRVAAWLSIVGELRAVEPPTTYAAVLADRVGPFAMRADLTVAVAADEATRRLHVTASGEDRQVSSRITATIDLAVTGDGDAGTVGVTGRYEITGRIATLGAGAIRKKGEHVLDAFFANMTRDLAAA